MGTSLKTVCFPFPPLASITNNTLTNFTQITLDLPEGSKVFKKVWVEFMADDIITATGGSLTTKTLGLRLAAVGYTTVTNSNTLTNSGENLSIHLAQDFTAHFTSNWSGTSMTCDLQVQINQSTGTTLGLVNGTALLWVTYEYDDTSATMVGNAWIPFDSALSGMATSKPGTANGTVPNLDSFLGYSTLSYKHCMVIMEGNEANAAGTTDFAVTVQIDSLTAQASGSHEAGLASDRFVRNFFNMMSGGSPLFTTNATHSLYWWVSTGAVARMNHCTMTMLVVFTYDASANNSGNISLLLPMDFEGPMGGTTSSDYQKAAIDLWIEEPATITIQDSAFRMFWHQIGTLGGLAFRCGSQSFNSYTDVGAVMCGSNALQRTCHDNISLSRGKNTISADVYRTDSSDLGWAVTGFWIINYKCGKPTGGWGKANHTVKWNLYANGTGAATDTAAVAATALTIPETSYFINNLGCEIEFMMHGASGQFGGLFVGAERLSGEGGIKWEAMHECVSHDDAEAGLRCDYGITRDGVFKRWIGDPDPNRIDIETSRRFRAYMGLMYPCWWNISLMLTYHSISFTVSGTVSGSGGGTVNLYLHDSTNMQLLLTGSRSGNGAYSLTWFDNTRNAFVEAYEDGTHLGRSDNGVGS